MKSLIKQAKPEFIEEATEILFDQVGQENLINLLNTKLRDYKVRVYHGTRLSEQEIQKIHVGGLRPLLLSERKATLVNMLQRHKRWPEVQSRLDEILTAIGPGNSEGRREDNCIHVCFSRMGLIKGCNHYLKQGAEVDSHIVYKLFGNDPTSIDLLKNDRKPYLISFLRSFEHTSRAANPYGVRDGETPSFLGLLIDTWAYSQFGPPFFPNSNCSRRRPDPSTGF